MFSESGRRWNSLVNKRRRDTNTRNPPATAAGLLSFTRSRDYITAAVLPLSRQVLRAFPARFTFRETPANFTSAKSRATSSSKQTTHVLWRYHFPPTSTRCLRNVDSIRSSWRQIQFTPEGSEVGRTLISTPIGRVFALSWTLLVLFWQQDMRRSFSYASSRTNIENRDSKGCLSALYTPRNVSRGCDRYSATLVDCRHGYERLVPRSFPTYARESANSRKFWQFRSPATRRGPRMRHFRFNPACIRASQRKKKTGKTLASTRTRFSRKTFSSSTSPLPRQRRTHLRNAARDRNFRSTRSKWTSDTKCDRLPRPPRRDWDATGACACSARLPLGRASHGSRSVSVAPAARIVARTSLSLSLPRTEVRPARTLCDRTPLLLLPRPAPNFIENPYLRFFLRRLESKIVRAPFNSSM